MTNYNERLDEILNTLGERHIMVEHRLIHLGMPEQNGKNIETRKTKQALTSLIKELVAEAKPDKLEESDYTLNMRVPHNPPSNTTRTNLYRKGYNDSLDQFEQNLLKQLEEV